MKVLDIQKMRYRDDLTVKRRRRFLIRSVIWSIAGLALVVALGYSLFCSPWFAVQEIGATGLPEARASVVRDAIYQDINQRWLGIPTRSNTVLFPVSRLESSLATSLPFIQDIDIERKSLHTIAVSITERELAGIWCFQDDCRYFDEGGVLIGQAPHSSGFLLLTVDDLRISDELTKTIDRKFLNTVMKVVSGLDSQGFKIKNVVIQSGSFVEFDAMTVSGYPIRFSLDSDIDQQLRVLEIFRKQRSGASASAYQYIDLRFEGRVYFK